METSNRIDFDNPIPFGERGLPVEQLEKRRQIFQNQLDSIMAAPEEQRYNRFMQTALGPRYEEAKQDPRWFEQSQLLRSMPQMDTGGFKAQIGPLYHGSPYKFSQFVDEKIGTGTGGQAFGYGHYTSEVPGVAGYYQKLGKERDATLQLYKGTEPIAPESKIERLAYDNAVFSDSIDNAIASFERSIEYLWDPKRPKPQMYSFVTPQSLKESKEILNVLKQWKKEGIQLKIVEPEATYYQTTLHKGKSPTEYTYIEWDKPLSQEIKNKIIEQGNKEGNENLIARTSNLEGSSIVLGLERILGSQKAASDFLQRIGISGIKYPVGSLSGKTNPNFSNYVTFDPSQITIDRIGRQRVVPIEQPEELRSVAWNLFKSPHKSYFNTTMADLKKAISSKQIPVEEVQERLPNLLYEAAQMEIKRGMNPMLAMERVRQVGEQIDRVFPRPKFDYRQLKKQMGEVKDSNQPTEYLTVIPKQALVEQTAKLAGTENIRPYGSLVAQRLGSNMLSKDFKDINVIFNKDYFSDDFIKELKSVLISEGTKTNQMDKVNKLLNYIDIYRR